MLNPSRLLDLFDAYPMLLGAVELLLPLLLVALIVATVKRGGRPRQSTKHDGDAQ